MAIIYSYPTVNPVREDLVLGTDVSSSNKATKNFTIQSIIDLVTVATGDLQTVLNLGNVATGKDIDLTNNAFRGGNFVTTGGVSISGTTATGFTNVSSTAFTGTLATAAQPNVTSLGALTALVIDGPISGTNLITSSNLANAANDNVVSTLAIKTYVDNKVGLFDTLQEILANGNTTGGTDIAVSAGDDITFTDTSKVLMGTTANDNLEIYNDSANSIVIDKSPGALKLQTSLLSVRNEADTTQTISASAAGAVELYHGGAKKIETLVGGAKVTGAFEATTSGTFASLINTGTYSDSSGDVGTAGQILSSTGSGTNWVTEVPLYNWSYEGTSIPSGTAMTVTDGTNITTTWDAVNYDLTIATTGVPDGSGAANQVTYWSDADTLTGAAGFTFAGGATGKVAIGGELEVGGVLTDGTFTGSAGTYTGYVSITSTDFVGALTGNASTATQLAVSGAITMTGDVTLTGTYNYTQGGPMTLATSIADNKIMSKLLDNYSPGSAGTLAASDTILQAFTKLQASITATSGLTYEGTWDASTDTPTLSGTTPNNGVFYIVSVAGNTNLSGITDWKVGDWAIYVSNGSATDGWQKLDQTNEVLGSGTANKITKWTGTNTLGTGLIEDDGTTVTIGNSGNLVIQGNTTFGDANSDTATAKGPAYFESTIQLNTGIGLGSTPDYGTAGQVLTSGGGTAGTATWTTPTTGTVTSVALTETGDALTITGSPITGSGTINIAGAGSASQYINGALDLVTFPTLDNYVDWKLQGDSGTNQDITKQTVVDFAGGTYITTATTTDTLTINHDDTTRTDTTSTDAPAFGGTFDAVTSVTTNTQGHVTAIDVSTVTIPSLPALDNYQYWTLAGDSGTNQQIDSTNTATIAGGTGIDTVGSATDTLTINFNGTFPAAHGTQYSLPLWTTATTLGDSQISQNSSGSLVTINRRTYVTNVLTVDQGLGKGIQIGTSGNSPAHFNIGANGTTTLALTPRQGIHYAGQVQFNSTQKIAATIKDKTATSDFYGIACRVYITSGAPSNSGNTQLRTSRIYDVACIPGQTPVWNKVIDQTTVGTLEVEFIAYTDGAATPKRGFTIEYTTNSATNTYIWTTIEMLSSYNHEIEFNT